MHITLSQRAATGFYVYFSFLKSGTLGGAGGAEALDP